MGKASKYLDVIWTSAFEGFSVTAFTLAILFEVIVVLGYVEQRFLYGSKVLGNISLERKALMLHIVATQFCLDLTMILISASQPLIKIEGKLFRQDTNGHMNIWAQKSIFTGAVRFLLMAVLLVVAEICNLSAGAAAIFVSCSTAAFGHLVATIIFPPEEDISMTKRVFYALRQTAVACVATVLTVSLYPLTLAAASFPNTFGWNVLKGSIFSLVSTLSTETFRAYLGIVRSYKQKSLQKLHKLHMTKSLPPGVKLDVIQLAQNPDILDIEEAHELAFTNSTHFMAPFYKLPSQFIIAKSPGSSFHINVILNIILDVVVRAMLTRNRRKKEVEELHKNEKNDKGAAMDVLIANLEQNQNGTGTIGRTSILTDHVMKTVKGNATLNLERINSSIKRQMESEARVHDAKKQLLVKSIMLAEAVRSISDLTGGYTAITLMWLISVAFVASDALYPPEQPDRCSAGGLNQLDITLRSIEMIALRIPADLLLQYFGTVNGIPYHLVKIRFYLSMQFGIAMFGAQHIAMFLIAYRGQAVDYNRYAPACLPKNILAR
ncbi:hypothetical protein HDU97_009993 [Phlyctochytrium planicorne]|nr:hypothetical protein HDU97_009993 [Phlyctochytrium planicorne]